ncbi:ADP-ribose pyrophosphatase YjhB (NUDIX family) [Nocardia kruczakiae]|uniref:ADP-ribose pyrophosphatase YjhB (NUDIX family) n=1 Tax=Nocardia kruczakiae TaxID=261477 RepID=A0ABU1XMM1_9NOCA|nr:NUDIX domain-containing protein [Nocardia kruczakiae]MDR7171803.1 ADP-ribose pyrophosphatase YjhB (NUDIX family) [Nocardia kruczakiae]
MEQQSAVSLDVVALRFGADDTTVTFGVAPRQWDPFAGELALPGVLLGRGERLATAARRAIHSKLGVPDDAILAVGQLVTFDEPNRDPRGPTLSIAMWAVLGDAAASPGSSNGETGGAASLLDVRWVSFDDVPPLAFDHTMIVEVARERLADMLWKDLTFTRALIGEHFPATRAVALATALSGARPDPGNLNRTLAAIPGLTRTGERMRTKATGRPAAVWSFTDSAPGER